MSQLKPPRATDPEVARRALLARVRSTGAQGGRIDPHRAIATIDLSRADMALAALLAGAFVAAYLASLDHVSRFWTAIFTWLAGPLSLGDVGQRIEAVASVAQFAVPYFAAHAAPPGPVAWWVTLVVTVLAVAFSTLMRGTWLPLAYSIRFAAAVQATALVFFAIAPARFPYDLAAYISGMMLAGAVLIGIVPIVMGLTFFLVDVGWSRKAALAALIMAHLLVAVPLQYALQAVLIVHGTLIVLPLCFILFGMLPEIMVLIALFGWGMSWAPLRARGRRQ